MKNVQLLAAVCFVCLSAAQSRAIASDLDDLAYFEGVWECEGKALDAASNASRDVSSIYTVTSTLGGNWLQATIFEKQTDGVATQIASRMIGYDAAWKRYVTYETSNDGAWAFLSTADGWTSKMHWTGYIHNFQGKTASDLEESVRKVSQDAFNVMSSVRDATGHWATLYDGSCHRQTN